MIAHTTNGKLTSAQIAAIRDGTFTESDAAFFNVSEHTIKQVRSSRAFKNGLLPPPAENDSETRLCIICGTEFGRCFDNGRRRTEKLWASKRTCSHTCRLKASWRAGAYDHIRK